MPDIWVLINDPENAGFLRLFASATTWILILGGWFVVNSHNNDREKRKELRASLDLLKVDILAITQKAVSFHVNSYYSSYEAMQIVSNIKSINRSINRLHVSDAYKLDIQPQSNKFKQRISLVNFDSSSFCPQVYDSPVVMGIIKSSEDYIDSLETMFSDHLNSFWRRYFKYLLSLLGFYWCYF